MPVMSTRTAKTVAAVSLVREAPGDEPTALRSDAGKITVAIKETEKKS